jgi:hypothetical protein
MCDSLRTPLVTPLRQNPESTGFQKVGVDAQTHFSFSYSNSGVLLDEPTPSTSLFAYVGPLFCPHRAVVCPRRAVVSLPSFSISFSRLHQAIVVLGPYFSHPPYETAQYDPRRVPKGWRSSRQRLASFQDENGPRDRLVSVAVAKRRGLRGKGTYGTRMYLEGGGG